jgi:peptidoglycan/LPS O-acetylase OafA/YrhL
VPLLILVGLSIGSYPQEHEDWSAWSMQLHRLFVDSIFIPPGSAIARRFSTFAVQMCAIAIFLSPSLQEILSHRFFMWLGHHSFAVYLVHGTILRTVGMWIVYGISGEPWTPAGTDEDGSPKEQEWLLSRGRGYITLAIIVFIALTYTAAWAWMHWVDSACARATAWLERKAFEDENKDGLVEKGLANGNGHAHRIGPSAERQLGNGPEQQRPRSRP